MKMIEWIFSGVFKTITCLAIMVFLFCACCLDSENYLPFFAGMVISFVWIVVSVILAGMFEI